MAALKLPRRMPTKPRVEAIEREEYAEASAPSRTIRRSFATMAPAPAVVPDFDKDDGFPAFMLDGQPPRPSRAELDAPVRIHTRKL